MITGLDLRLHPTPTQRITAIAGFDDLDALIDVGREFRDADGIAALELIDARASALTAKHMGVGPAVGVDTATRQRLWQVREAVADVLGIYGPPLKFDVSLPLSMIAQFATAAARLVGEHAPDAIPVLFGHIGEGNLHLNLARCVLDTETERALYSAMMALIAQCRGNVSSEHGVGTRKRDYLTMSRTGADIAPVRPLKTAFDLDGHLNPAVLFDDSVMERHGVPAVGSRVAPVVLRA
ncbi:MAG: hypothetical protein QOI01_6512 [Mycobacterium sp.]|nr:hypothetical protein [Mycobacterium sp.]